MNRRPSILDQTAHTKTILNDRARFSVKDIGFLVQQFEGVYSKGNMVQTTTDTVERSSQKPRKAGVKEQQETNNITDAVLKYEGKSFNWNGIVICIGLAWHKPMVKYTYLELVLKSTLRLSG